LETDEESDMARNTATGTATPARRKRFKLIPEMEGATARWYARLRRSGDLMEEYRRQAAELTEGLPDGADVLEVAPGPGYHAIEIARLGRFNVTGLDISRTFVEIATENARAAGVSVDFRQGDAAELPFAAGTFDLIVCQAAFKNFTRPIDALDEMRRALRPGGLAVIQDLRRDASAADIGDEVRAMRLSPLNAFMTRRTLALLRRRAHSTAQFERLVAESAFRTCDITTDGVGIEVRLRKPRA
jgi:ubiquinone/menaquinone biosynthesis C-methylase UbiE